MRKLLVACIAATALLAVTATTASAYNFVYNNNSSAYCPTGPDWSSGCSVGVSLGDFTNDLFDVDATMFGVKSDFLNCGNDEVRMYVEGDGYFRVGDIYDDPDCDGPEGAGACGTGSSFWSGRIFPDTQPNKWWATLDICLDEGSSPDAEGTVLFEVTNDANGDLLFTAERQILTEDIGWNSFYDFAGSMRQYDAHENVNGQYLDNDLELQ